MPNSPAVPASPMSPRPITTGSGPLTSLIFNLQHITSRVFDIRDLLSSYSPDLLFFQETHLSAREHRSLPQLRALLSDYTLVFSGVHSDPLQTRRRPYVPGRAPGGVLLGVSTRLTRHPLVKISPVPENVSGYCAHMTLPLPEGGTLHLLSVYFSPTDSLASAACSSYLKEQVQQHDPSSHFFIIAGDFNLPTDSPPFQALCTNLAVVPVNATTSKHLTHFPHSASCRPSMIDDLLVSTSLLHARGHSTSHLTCTVPTTQYGSDHLPLIISMPTSLLPVLMRPDTQPEDPSIACGPPQRSLVFPISAANLQSSREQISTSLTLDCEALHCTLHETLCALHNSIPHNDMGVPLIPWSECQKHIHALNIDIPALACQTTDLLSQALNHMLSTCPTRLPQHAVGKTFYFPRSIQRKVKRHRLTLKILTFAKLRVQTWLARGLFDDANPIVWDSASSDVATHLLHAFSCFHIQELDDASAAAAVMDTLPFLPCTDTSSAWVEWLASCQLKIKGIRDAVKKLTSPIRDSAVHRRRLAKLLRFSPRKGHAHIFGTSLGPEESQSADIDAIWDSATQTYHTAPSDMQSFAQSYFTREWARDPGLNPADPYPFEVPGCQDPLELSPPQGHTDAHSSLLPYVLRQFTFDKTISSLKRNKSAGPDGIPNELLMIMPPPFKSSLRLLFILMWLTGHTPEPWKQSDTILPHKRGSHTLLGNKRPIGLHRTIYKLWTKFVTNVLYSYSEEHSILSASQEGFRLGCSTSRQLQRLAHLLENAAMTNSNIYALYIDFTNAFNTIDHQKLFRIMADLGFPPDSIAVVADLYSGVSTRVVLQRSSRLATAPIPVGRGTIQGDTLSPLIFLLYLEPLLRWLATGSRGYTPRFHTPDSPDTSTPVVIPSYPALTFADDLTALTSTPSDLLIQFTKILAYCRWGGLSLNPTKCAATGALHQHALTGFAPSLTDQTSLLIAQLEGKLVVGDIPVPILPPDKPYKYLGVWMTMTLNFSFHFASLAQDILAKGRQLVEARVSAKQSLHIINRVLKPKIAYCFPIAPFSETDIEHLDGLLVKVAKICMGLKTGFPNKVVLAPTHLGGVGLHSLLLEYTQIATQTLTRALNDQGDLGLLTRRMLLDQQAAGGQLPAQLRHRSLAHFSHPLALRLLSIMHASEISLHRPPEGIVKLLGTDMWRALCNSPTPCPLPASAFAPLWKLGFTSLRSLTASPLGIPHMLPSETLAAAFKGRVKNRLILNARLALNKLTLLLNGSTEDLSHYSKVSSLPVHQRRIALVHNFIHLPQPGQQHLRLSQLATRFPFPVHSHITAAVSPVAPPSLDLAHLPPPARRSLPACPIPPAHFVDQSPPLLSPMHTPPSAAPPTHVCDGEAAFSSLVPDAGAPSTPLDDLLCDRLVTFSTTPVNPDFDIYPTGDYSIQVGVRYPNSPSIVHSDRAFVYRPDGTCAGSLSIARLAWLRQCYEMCRTDAPTPHSRYSHGSFERDLVALFGRYPPSPSTPTGPNSTWCLPERVSKAMRDNLSVICHRFSSPLDVSPSAASYFSKFPQDSLFGAQHESYSELWTGPSFVHPPFISGSILKSLRWAIASCSHSTAPTFTVMLLPCWPRSSYASWLRHPAVRASCRIPAGTFSFDMPCSSPAALATADPPINSKWPLQLLVVANLAGMARYGARPTLSTFAASSGLRLHPCPTTSQPSPPDSPCMLWGPPSGFTRLLTCPAPPTVNPLPAPADPSPSKFPPYKHLCWPSETAYYTDGACQKHPDGGTRLGASFHMPLSGDTFLVNPGGARETKTIMRAELAAIYAALLHLLHRQPSLTAASVFTDSLASIYLIQRVLRAPATLSECKHFPLLRRIRSLLLVCARTGILVHIQKVKSHIGVSGNEAADAGAALALEYPSTCHYDFSNMDVNYFASLPAWPCVRQSPTQPSPLTSALARAATAGMPSRTGLFFLSNLTTAVSSFVLSFCPHRSAGTRAGTSLYDKQQELNTISLPTPSNNMWHTCPYKLVKNILQIRFHMLWTASRALQINRPYKTAAGVATDGLCHICPPSSAPRMPDTTGHILGSCRHPELKACYIARHNKALLRIHSAFMQGSKATSLLILDATARDQLPHGVYHNRIPQWMLPTVPPDILKKLRPDILLMDGFPLSEAPKPTMSRLSQMDLRRIQQRCTLVIAELGYTIESLYSERLTDKRQQHLHLVSLLLAAGWNIAFNLADFDYVHFIILGSAGTIFCNVHSTLLYLGLSPSQVVKLLSSLNTHATQSAFSIVTLRRHIEKSIFHGPGNPPDPP